MKKNGFGVEYYYNNKIKYSGYFNDLSWNRSFSNKDGSINLMVF